jgi:hypothetical protein
MQLRAHRTPLKVHIEPKHVVVEQLIASGHYTYLHPLLKEKRIRVQMPPDRPQGGIKTLGLVSFGMELSMVEFLRRLPPLGVEPAGLLTFLQVGASRPDTQHYFRIICGTDFGFDRQDELSQFAFALDSQNEEPKWKRVLDLEPLNKRISAFTCMLCAPIRIRTIPPTRA